MLQGVLPVQIDVPQLSSILPGIKDKNMRAAKHGTLIPLCLVVATDSSSDGTALIILSLILSNIRSCVLPSSKLKALDLLLYLSCYLTDEAKLDRLIPYVVDLLHDESALVRAGAIRTILQVVRTFVYNSRSTMLTRITSAHSCLCYYPCQCLYYSGIYSLEYQAPSCRP